MYLFICLILGVILRILNKSKTYINLKNKILLYITIILNLGYRIGAYFINVTSVLIPIEIISLFLIVTFICKNKEYAGVLTIGIGYILNLIVMLFNNGKMPVLTNIIQLDYRHVPITALTKLRLLADVIYLPYPLDIGMKVSSIGDLIIGIGIMLIIRGL